MTQAGVSQHVGRLEQELGPFVLRRPRNIELTPAGRYHAGGETAFKAQIKRIEEAAVDSIYSALRLRGTDEWTEALVKEKASNFVTTLLTLFTYDLA